MPMGNAKITGIAVVINKLSKVQKSFQDLNPLMDLISSRMIGHFNMGNTPVLTGWFLSNIVVINKNSRSITVGEDLKSVVYAARVIFGLNKHGGPFSPLGHHMFERETPKIAGIVIAETEQYINKILR